jgi:hypothetical protein
VVVDEGNGSGSTEEPRSPRRVPGGASTTFSRLFATIGIVGIGTGAAAIMGSQDVEAWIIGIVVSGMSVFLAALFWGGARGL